MGSGRRGEVEQVEEVEEDEEDPTDEGAAAAAAPPFEAPDVESRRFLSMKFIMTASKRRLRRKWS